jgi:hypothetical protein
MISTNISVKKTVHTKATVARVQIGTSASFLPVLIYDQYSNVLASLTSGQTYNVLVFDGIIDSGPPYTNSIVNP